MWDGERDTYVSTSEVGMSECSESFLTSCVPTHNESSIKNGNMFTSLTEAIMSFCLANHKHFMKF